MDIRTAAVFVLLLHIDLLRTTSADFHSLQYLHSSVTEESFPQFTAVGLVDGEQFVNYDNNIGKMIPKTEWIQKITTADIQYWDRETTRTKSDETLLKQLLSTVMKLCNQTAGVHTAQRLYGCELDDDGTTGGYDLFGYDGEDFLSLHLKTHSWIAANDEAKAVLSKWELEKSNFTKSLKSYLENDCINQLKMYMEYSRKTLERKVLPEVQMFQQQHSSSTNLVCHATGFFPRAVMMSWQKDGEEVEVGEVELRETLPNQDGSFQKRIILRVLSEHLQKHKYTCLIQHSSLKEHLKVELKGGHIFPAGKEEDSWNVTPGSTSDGETAKKIIFGICLSGLTVFVIVAVVKSLKQLRRNERDTVMLRRTNSAI